MLDISVQAFCHWSARAAMRSGWALLIFLPQVVGDDSPGQRFLTVHAFDQVLLPVFTSVESLAAQFGHAVNGYTDTTYAELRRKWPNPQ